MHPALLLLLLVPSLLAPAATAEQSSGCWPKTCGDLNITYPFWVQDEPGGPPCGSPSFQINCTSTGAFLVRSVLQAYKVLNIFTHNRSVHVVDQNLPLATGCPAPTMNVSFPGPELNSGKSNRELLFLGKCTESKPQDPSGFHSLPCDNTSFVRLGDGRNFSSHGIPGGVPPSCLFAIVPILGAPDGNGEDYIAGMRNGFLLEWTDVPEDCPRCMESGGGCVYSPAFSCNCSGSLQPEVCVERRHRHRKHKQKLILVAMVFTSTSLTLACLVWIMYRRREKYILFIQNYTVNVSSIEEILRGYHSLVPKRYKYSEIKKITGSFKDKLGEGGYGMVFKGKLENGHEVAVKLLKGSKGNGEEFMNEVISIRGTSHVNVVNLLGFCLHGPTRALIYEYMTNGSLDKYIYSEESKMTIGWEMLKQIAIGIARGLEYLHRGCNTRIIHFDIKPHNILLDEDFCPKIADFGLAKLCHLKDSALSMAEARGTIGFIAPEVFSRGFGVVSTKSDVYSYGMMLLEMVGGRKNFIHTETSSHAYFPNCAYDRLVKDLQGHEVTCETEEIERQMTLVGLWCIQTAPGNRPSMSRVIEMLEKNINELEMPPKPFLSCPSEPPHFSS